MKPEHNRRTIIARNTAGAPMKIALCTKRGAVRGYALIDREDAMIATRPWHLNKGAARSFYRVDGLWVPRYMHRVIMDAQPGQIVDHINGDKLDNRRANLRLATTAENAQNRFRRQCANPISRYRGVTWRNDRKRWVARHVLDGRVHHIGVFENEDDAGAAAAAWRAEHMPFSEEARSAAA